MKITNDTSIGAGSITPKKTGVSEEVAAPESASSANVSSAAGGGDRVEFSGAEGQIGQLRTQLDAIPDERADVVQSFKDKIDSGTYWDDHNPEDIASAMIQHFEKYKNMGS